jgi:hypothetical protein
MIKINFDGVHLQVPGAYGPPQEWYVRFDFLCTIEKLYGIYQDRHGNYCRRYRG